MLCIELFCFPETDGNNVLCIVQEVINIEYPGDASHNSDTLIFQTSGVLSTLDITVIHWVR